MLVVLAKVVTNVIVLVILPFDEIASQLQVQFSYDNIAYKYYYSIMAFCLEF
jgi:hypothetical protein